MSLDGILLRLEILSCAGHGVFFDDAPSLWIGRESLFATRYAGLLRGFEHGFFNMAVFAPAPTTYFEITGGLNISPTIPQGTPLLKPITFRPEVRYDAALNNTMPFDGQSVPGGRGFPGFGTGINGDLIAKF